MGFQFDIRFQLGVVGERAWRALPRLSHLARGQHCIKNAKPRLEGPSCCKHRKKNPLRVRVFCYQGSVSHPPPRSFHLSFAAVTPLQNYPLVSAQFPFVCSIQSLIHP